MIILLVIFLYFLIVGQPMGKYTALVCGIHLIWTLFVLNTKTPENSTPEAEAMFEDIKKEKMIVFLVFIPIYAKALGFL